MSIVHNEPPRYRSYVLRCWEMRSQIPKRPAMWRFSLEEARTGEKHTFADLEALVTFLQAELAKPESEKAPSA
jgi:hypothetical protein